MTTDEHAQVDRGMGAPDGSAGGGKGAAPLSREQTKPTDEPGEPAVAPQPAPDPGPARRIDQLTAVLLLTAAGTAIAAAAPSILRAVGAPLPVAEPTAATPPLDLRHQPPELLAHPDPLFDPDHDGDPDDAPSLGARPVDPVAADHAKPGQARGALALRDRPADGGRPVGEVKAGEVVMIVREAGDWALVWAGGDDGIVMGWAKKSGIAVR